MARPKAFDESQVLDQAVNLFWERGFHATSIQQLVDHLGINRASLYDTFGGKEELYRRAFHRYRERNKAIIQQMLTANPSPREAFRELLYRALDEPAESTAPKGCLLVNAASDLLPEEEWLRDLLDQNRREFEQMFADIIRAGQQSGDIQPQIDPAAVASLLFTLYSGIKVVSKMNGQPGTMTASIDAALSLLNP